MSLKTNYKEKETLRERGTKRYQERIVEEKEAEKEIEEFINREESIDNYYTIPEQFQ